MLTPKTPTDARGAVYSFDVFDTCISRCYAYPRDLFYELGLRLAPADSSDDPKVAARFAKAFQARRIRAERLAYRYVKPNECPAIREIYERFDSPAGLQLDIDSMVAAELALERESIYPVPSMLAKIGELRSLGHRIIFISDMYLPGRLLRPILEQLGAMQKEDGLYVSCDIGLTKHSGNLYRHVLAQEGIEPGDLYHTGDNVWADVTVAERLGIRATHFDAGMLTPREAMLAGRALPRSRGQSALAALSRRVRLALRESSGNDHHPLDAAISGTISPFLVAYVAWVLDDASTRGIDRLYFVARDGEILYKIAGELRKDGDPEIRYLYGSRRSWLAPSIREEEGGWKRLLITAGQSNSRHDILARAGIDGEAVAEIQRVVDAEEEWSAPLSHDAAVSFLARVLAVPSASRVLHDNAKRQRRTALAYLEKAGLTNSGSWALVDAGWSLNSQAALRRILLDRPGIAEGVQGYYIALTHDHLPEAEAGGARAFISPAGSIFSRRRVIIEHCFTPSTHATTRHYSLAEGLVSPVFGPELRDEAELDYARRLHGAAIVMARLVAESEGLREQLRQDRRAILSHAEEFLRKPDPNDARAMASFGTVADLRHEKAFVQPLCRALRVSDLGAVIGMTFSKRKSFRAAAFMWLEGSAALSPIHVQLPLRFMLAVDWLRQILAGQRR